MSAGKPALLITKNVAKIKADAGMAQIGGARQIKEIAHWVVAAATVRSGRMQMAGRFDRLKSEEFLKEHSAGLYQLYER